MDAYINHNGKIVTASDIHLSPDNRSFKYGDGCFETMKAIEGKFPLLDLHLDRLFYSLLILKFTVPKFFSRAFLTEQLLHLIEANKHRQLARVRLTIYRGDGGLYDAPDNTPHFIIQSWMLNKESNQLNSDGLTLDFYPDARKAVDILSSLKSNNYLPYAMAAMWAKENKVNDCLLFNCYNRIADATIANVFVIADDVIKTPSLDEGCVNGVMRRYLIEKLKQHGFAYTETALTVDDVLNASEVFLTNAVSAIRWVGKIGERRYSNSIAKRLFDDFILPLYK